MGRQGPLCQSSLLLNRRGKEVQKGKFKWPGLHTQGSVLAVTTPEGRTVTLCRSGVGGLLSFPPLSWPQFPHLENENKNFLPLSH